MSRMKDLAIQIDEAGIDYRLVDLADVEALQAAYHQKTGQVASFIEAARELYLDDETFLEKRRDIPGYMAICAIRLHLSRVALPLEALKPGIFKRVIKEMTI
jgi:hypothetical protein